MICDTHCVAVTIRETMPLNPAPAAALFDFDGVIIDSREAVRTAINDALTVHGLPPRPGPELDRFIGPPAPAAFAELTGKPAASPFVAACVDTYHERYTTVYLELTELIDGVGAVLERLARSLRLALATAKPAEFAEPLLDKLGLAQCFEVVAAPTISAQEEDKAVTVARALRALRGDHAVMVGDRYYDIDAAHANGLRAIGVTWGIGDLAELDGAGADVIIDRPDQLLELLEPR
jgi:phosphoglycolate phosphatase